MLHFSNPMKYLYKQLTICFHCEHRLFFCLASLGQVVITYSTSCLFHCDTDSRDSTFWHDASEKFHTSCTTNSTREFLMKGFLNMDALYLSVISVCAKHCTLANACQGEQLSESNFDIQKGRCPRMMLKMRDLSLCSNATYM